MYAVKLLVLLFVGYVHGHGYISVPHSRVSRCFLGNARVAGVWTGGSTGDQGCDQAFRDALSRGSPSATAQFTSRMAYVGQNLGGLRSAFENGQLLSNSEVCSAGSQATYRGTADFRSMDGAFGWYLNELPRSNGRYTDVRLQFCATAPHNPNRWFIYHFKHDPRTVPVTWDRLEFVRELPNQDLLTTPGPLSSCFVHDSPHNSFYDLSVPLDLQAVGTIVVVQQTTGWFNYEYNINCVDYRTGSSSPPPPPPPPPSPPPPPPPSDGCPRITSCGTNQSFRWPATNPTQFYQCHQGFVQLSSCQARTAFAMGNQCINLPVPESLRWSCQDWSNMPLYDEF
jgi:predicted carbohydrate-binding protein with CBM5 and CBM33 domain